MDDAEMQESTSDDKPFIDTNLTEMELREFTITVITYQ